MGRIVRDPFRPDKRQNCQQLFCYQIIVMFLKILGLETYSTICFGGFVMKNQEAGGRGQWPQKKCF